EELLHLREKARGVRRGLLVALALELVEQVGLTPGQVLGRLDLDLDVHVAGHLRAQHRHTLALEPELLAGLRPLRNFHPRLAAVHGRHIEVAAERGGGHGDGHAAKNVGAVALEELVRLDREKNVEVAGRTATHAGLAFAGEADAGAVFHAGRNVHRKRALLHDAPRAATGGTRIIDDLAAPLAGRTRALDGKEALRGAYLAGARAGRRGGGLRAGPGAAARARFACHAGGHADLRGLAGEGLGKRDLHVVAQIGAALATGALPTPAAPPAHELAEQV